MWIVIHLHKSKVAHQIDGGMFSSLADYWSLLLTRRGDTHFNQTYVGLCCFFPAEEVSEWIEEVVGIEAKRHQQVGYQNSNGFPTQSKHRCRFSIFFWGGLESLSHKTRRFSTTFGTKSWMICWVDSLPEFAGIESVSQRWAESWYCPHQHVGWRRQKMFNLVLL